MKKGILGAIILLSVAGVCAPFVNGLVMEKVVTQTFDDLNAMYAEMGSGVTIAIDKYDRGFATSKVDWRIKLGNLANLYGVNEILLVDRAEHGYIGVVSTTSLEKNPWFTERIKTLQDKQNPLHIATSFSVTGKIESVIDIAPFSIQLHNKTVNFRSGKIITEGENGLTHLVSTGTWGGLSVSDEIQIESVSMAYDLEKISTYIWDGAMTCSIQNIRMQDQEASFELVDFKAENVLNFDKNKNLLSTGGEIVIGSIVAENETVTDIALRLGISNIDAPGYEEFMKQYTQTTYTALGRINADGENPETTRALREQQLAASGMQMMAASEKLLKKGLKFSISDLQAQLSSGSINGKLEVQLLQDITFAQLIPIAMQPGLAFNLMSLQSRFSFPQELAGDNTTLVTPLLQGMQTGLFVEDGEKLVHQAQISNGKLILNGNEVVLN